jgi:hypothetical protein
MAELLDQRLQLVISKGQVRAIDEWRRKQPDLPSRSAAIRQLIDAGLRKIEPSSTRPGGARKPRSAGKSASKRQ